MTRARRTRLRLAVLVVAMAAAPLHGEPLIDMSVIPTEWRDAAKPLPVRLELGQVEIRAGINPVKQRGGGLIGALMDGAAESSRNKNANSALDEIRDALDDFDADPLVLSNTQSALARLSWLKLLGDRPERMASDEVRARAEESQPGMRLLVLEYGYELSADFSVLTVDYKLRMARPPKPGKKPDAYRDWYPAPAYVASGRVVTSFVGLPADREQRKALLIAKSGKLLKDNLRDSFTRAAILAARTVEITQPQKSEVLMKGKPTVETNFGFKAPILEGGKNIEAATTVIGEYGPKMTVRPDSEGVLLWIGGFSHFQAKTVTAGTGS